MPARALPRVLPLAFPTLLFLACAKGPPSGGVGTYLGVATSTTEIGLMEVTVAESDKGPLPATGTVNFPNKLITLTGTLDKSKTQLVLTSSDGYTMVAESRPAYALGHYMNAADANAQGSFALLLQAADAPIESFCGSYSNTTATEEFTYPLAIAAAPGGQAICVGPNFTWLGSLGTDDSLNCATSGGLFQGDVNSTGNPWGTVDYNGTWAVTSCTGNGQDGDAGVPDGDPGDTAAQDGGVDAPIQTGADAAVDAAVPAGDAGAQD